MAETGDKIRCKYHNSGYWKKERAANYHIQQVYVLNFNVKTKDASSDIQKHAATGHSAEGYSAACMNIANMKI